ncbi:MAG: ABC transporter permease [bacterium]|nr:ABC transporter permease [bacterium]
MVTGRYIAFRIFLKDMKADYSKTFLGIFWDFMEPIVVALVFILLKQGNIINFGEMSMPYPIFVVYGLLLFQTFSDGLLLPLDILKKSTALISQTRVPPEALLLSLIFRISYYSTFRIIVMLGLSIYMGTISWTGFIQFVLLYPIIILAGLSFGILLSVFNTVYNDIGKLIRISIRPLMFTHPVVFPIHNIKILALFNTISPLGVILTNLRLLATQGVWVNPSAFWITCGSVMVLFFISWFIFHLSVSVLVERV